MNADTMRLMFKTIEDKIKAKVSTEPGARTESRLKHLAFCTFITLNQKWNRTEAEVKQFQDQFESTNVVEERLDIVLNHKDILESISDLVNVMGENFVSETSKKSASEASEAKEMAKKSYKKKDLNEALKWYQQALLEAPFPGDEGEAEGGENVFAACLISRSTVLFDMKEFDACIEDIDEAIESGVPEARRPVLMVRKLKALKAIGKRKEADQVYGDAETVIKSLSSEEVDIWTKILKDAMSGTDPTVDPDVASNEAKGIIGENLLLPFASPSVEVGSVPEKGRIMRAVKDIEPGEVVIDEAAFVSLLNESSLEKRCSHCLKILGLRFTPCSRCTAVRYCSSSCRSQAWSSWHEVECDLIELFKFFPMGLMALRFLLATGVTEALRVMEEPPVPAKELVGKVFSVDFPSFWSLRCISPKVSEDWLGYTLSAVFMSFVTMRFMGEATENISLRRLSLLYLQMMLRIRGNQSSLANVDDYYGVGLFVTNSLLSHSCFDKMETISRLSLIPNVGNRMTKVVIKPIKAGEEVTTCYGPEFGLDSYQVRQNYYRESYGFDCNCIACLSEEKKMKLCHFCATTFRGKGHGPTLCSQACFVGMFEAMKILK